MASQNIILNYSLNISISWAVFPEHQLQKLLFFNYVANVSNKIIMSCEEYLFSSERSQWSVQLLGCNYTNKSCLNASNFKVKNFVGRDAEKDVIGAVYLTNFVAKNWNEIENDKDTEQLL